jgi:hypothetical protein
MDKLDKSTQTEEVLAFSLARLSTRSSILSSDSKIQRSLLKISKRVVDIEDYIIDQIAIEHTLYAKSSIKNTALRNPLKNKVYFTLKDDKLLANFVWDIEILRSDLCPLNGSSFVDQFESCFCELLLHRTDFINKFQKYVYKPNRTVLQALVTFVYFLSCHFKSKVLAFIAEFLLIALHSVYQVSPNYAFVIKHLIEHLEDSKTIVTQTEERFFSLLGDCKDRLLNPQLIFQLFLDYLVSNDFLSLEDIQKQH